MTCPVADGVIEVSKRRQVAAEVSIYVRRQGIGREVGSLNSGDSRGPTSFHAPRQRASRCDLKATGDRGQPDELEQGRRGLVGVISTVAGTNRR